MFTQFQNYALKNVGVTAQTLVTVPAANQYMVNQLSLSNTTSRDVTCSVTITRAGVVSFLARDAVVPQGGSLACAGRRQTIVLMAGDVVQVQSSTATSIDAMVSGLLNDFNPSATVPAPVVPVTPGLLTVNNWELGRVPNITSPVFVQIACPNNTGAPYTTLAARTAGSQMILLPQNITVTCPTAPSLLPSLNRVTFTDLTGAGIPAGTGSLGIGTQIQLL
jgi:hypothetical protein